MLQRTVYKSKAIMAGICIVAALLALSVFPLRLWCKTVAFEGTGKPIVMSESVDMTRTVSQVFVADYARLQSVDVYVAEVSGGRYLKAELQSSYGEVLFSRMIDMAESETPGYVHIKAGVSLTPGMQYRLYLKGQYSAFRLGLEPVSENPAANMGAFFYEYDPHPSLRLQLAVNYDVPLSRGYSLLVIAALAAACAFLCALVRTWFSGHPDRDKLLLLSGVTEKTLYTLTGAFYLVLFVFNYPLKKFHDSPGEILFLAAGIVIAALVTFYAIRRFCTEPESGNKMALKDKIAAVFFALAIAYACEYMNGESNLMHEASERQMLVCLLVVVLLSFRTDMLVNRLNPVWVVLSGGGGCLYVLRHALHADTTQEALQNTVIRCNALIIVLAGLVLISAARSVFARVWKKPRLSWFGAETLLMMGVLIATGSSRVSEITMLLVFSVFYICITRNIPPERFMRILVWGTNINFILTVGYCLLFRAYQAFIFTRYGMVFSTVAITGEYLASVTLVAAAGLMLRFSKESSGTPRRMCIRHAWKEVILFAVAGVYAALTVSRTAYLTILTGLLLLLVVYGRSYRPDETGESGPGFLKRVLFCAGAMLCSCVLLFPGLFSMQRILPAIAGRHHVITYLEEENMVHDLLGSANWDSTYYISAVRFWSVFRARILREPELMNLRPEDRYNYDAYLLPLYDEHGNPVVRDEETEDGESQPVTAFTEVPEGTGENTVEVSNGRLDIYRTYLSRLTMRGHGVLYTEDPEYIHAHNSYIQVLYTNGIPAGLVFMLWTAGAVIVPLLYYHKSARIRKPDMPAGDEYLVTAAVSLAFATAALTEYNFQMCNPMCLLLFTGILPLIFQKEGAA